MLVVFTSTLSRSGLACSALIWRALTVGALAQVPNCTSVAWSADGATLYAGYTDGVIRVWSVGRAL